ncbi:MAG: HD domain-containing protein [Parcubacteria group bacterium]|nr:HD domain-containing protein [Parcubacteria group bacterium]
MKEYLRKDEKFRRVYEGVRKDFVVADLGAHNWEHIYRDILNAIVVGESERADMKIVLPAITLHDIGFLYGATGRTHAAIGAEKLPAYLHKIRIAYPEKTVMHIAACILTHKGSMHDEKPETLEAKVVADADLLDKFGPIGVYQYIRTWTEFKKGIKETLGRKKVILNLHLETKTGKRLAEKGRAFVTSFFSELEKAYRPYQ